MTPEEQAKFVTSLCNSCRDAILARIQYVPDTWDGMELRQYIAEEFARQTYLDKESSHRKRYREYKNDRNVKFGL